MKKIMAALLSLTMALTLFAGCGSKNGGKTVNDDPTGGKKTETDINTGKTDTDGDKDDKSSQTKEEIPGTELTSFMNNYTDSKSKIWEALSQDMDKNGNTSFALGTLGFAFADLLIVEIGLFDALSTKEGDMFKGTLMLTGIEAWKKSKGDLIEFGYDYVYHEDKNQNKKGDHEVASGKYDKKADSLVYKKYVERDGQKTSCYVVEITRNSQKSYSSLVCMMNNGNEGGKSDKTLSGYFTWFEGEDIISTYAEKENSEFDFTYESIFGKKNIKPEIMAKDMNVKLKTSFINGKAEYEEINN